MCNFLIDDVWESSLYCLSYHCGVSNVELDEGGSTWIPSPFLFAASYFFLLVHVFACLIETRLNLRLKCQSFILYFYCSSLEFFFSFIFLLLNLPFTVSTQNRVVTFYRNESTLGNNVAQC